MQVLVSQAASSLATSSVNSDLVGGVVTVSYWSDVPPLNLEVLLSDCSRKQRLLPHWSNNSRSMGSQIMLRSNRERVSEDRVLKSWTYATPVEIEHSPKLVDEKGELLTLNVTRKELSIEKLLLAARAAHTRCRLRVLFYTLSSSRSSSTEDQERTWDNPGSFSLGQDSQEVLVTCGSVHRLRYFQNFSSLFVRRCLWLGLFIVKSFLP